MQRNTNGTHPACAACKHQRKKCDEKCILASFFSADKSREFQAVHKVFGVSNVQKIVRSLDEKDRKTAADSLIWEAFCRQRDPILGSYGEYIKIYDELKLYKGQYQPLRFSSFMGWNSHGNNNNGQIIKGTTTTRSFGSSNINNNNNNNATSNNYGITGQGNSFPDPNLYISPSYNNHDQQGLEKLLQEGDLGTVVIPLQEQGVNEYNQQYYLPGKNSETVESMRPQSWNSSIMTQISGKDDVDSDTFRI